MLGPCPNCGVELESSGCCAMCGYCLEEEADDLPL